MSFTEKIAKLTDWKNEPTVSDLKTDFINCKPAHDNQMGIIDKYIRMYKHNQSKIQRRDTIWQFKEDMISVEEDAKEYQIVRIKRDASVMYVVRSQVYFVM